jgi:putative ABC transport system permease protein
VTAGSVADLGPGTIVVDRNWPGNPSVGSRVRVWLADGTPLNLTVAALFRTAGDGYQAYIDPPHAAAGSMPTQAVASTLNANASETRTAVLMILGLSVLYALIALADTLAMTVADRRRELALLRLAGATRRQVLGAVLAETLMCVATGVAVGLLATVLSVGGSWVALRLLIGPAMPLVVPWVVLAALVGVCVVVAVVAAGLPAGLTLAQADRHGLMRQAVDGGS